MRYLSSYFSSFLLSQRVGLFEETLENVDLLGIDAEVNKQTKSADQDSLTSENILWQLLCCIN